MTYPFENRMAVEGQRIQEDLYSTPDWEFFRDEPIDVRSYCDIYYCHECPKLGDDCDGKFEEDEDEFDE